MNGLRWWGIVIALLAVGALSNWRFFGPAAEGSLAQVTQIPHEFGSWHGEDVTLDERTYQILETRNVLYREYRAAQDSPPIVLCIVFSQINRKAPHPPEVCYTGAGAYVERRPYETLELSPTLGSIQGSSLLVRFGQTQEVVLYWYLAGTQLTTSYYEQQRKVIWAQITGRPAQSAMIRFSTVMIGNESQEEGMARLKSFAQLMLPTILKQLTS